ncbi:hypothetical protein PIB30_007617 [Stylosanthes scabra]|uniref:Uncharacterized protein n=1 Tax=Stylosanthes scabra TaxID=79078 RepID=A0ABU6V614_9FABA|nr:hypothetical protein [Stylosanthes scabra]
MLVLDDAEGWTRVASGGRGRGRDRRGNDRNIPMDNQAEFLAAMTNLANTIQAGVAAMNQARGNENADHQDGGDTMTLATFLKVNPPTFKGSNNPTEADN